MTETDLDRLLAAAASDSWAERAAAAKSLAGIDSPRAAAALMALLNDREDTAVVESAALALAAHGDAHARDLIFRALGEADAMDDDERDDTVSRTLFFLARVRGRRVHRMAAPQWLPDHRPSR